MTTKVNILIDGGFFLKKFKSINHHDPSAAEVQKEVETVMNLLKAKTGGETNDILTRVYYYDCRPFGETVSNHDGTSNVDFSASYVFTYKDRLIHDLCKTEKFAVRLGELSFDGWKHDVHNPTILKPDFKQKGVDMKVGLDMALMGMKHTVDKIILIAGDSDFIDPMKFVRREGLQVYLYTMGHRVKCRLIEHSDFILS